MIEVIVETRTYEGAWQPCDSAFCEKADMAHTARTLWDEAYTDVQGCKRRLTFEEAGAAKLQIEYRP